MCIIPLVVAVLFGVYGYTSDSLEIIGKPIEMALVIISILMGFSLTVFALLGSSNNKAVEKLKAESSSKALNNHPTNLYRKTLIQVSRLIIIEVLSTMIMIIVFVCGPILFS